MKKQPGELLNILTDRGFSKFQIAVYKATLKIPIGQTRTYSQIAKQIKRPKAVRAVANALAKNPLPLVIPCHRVIRKDGNIGGYRWGKRLKKKLIQLEKIHVGREFKYKTNNGK
jgi:O-6-methylguanine DNA methyltransferase